MPAIHDFGGVLGRPSDTFFWLSQFHGHGSWVMCEVALIPFHNALVHDCQKKKNSFCLDLELIFQTKLSLDSSCKFDTALKSMASIGLLPGFRRLKSAPSQLLLVFPRFDRLQTCCH
jgi:hypothetical protein